MANRSYLYSLSNRPTSYADRPETISGLSEWAYDVPFIYRLLMSGDPQLCASLVSDGLDDDEPDSRTRLYAISSPFEPGFERVKRFAEILRVAVAVLPPAASAAPAAPPAPASFFARLKRLFSPAAKAASSIPVQAATTSYAPPSNLLVALNETIAFLEAHRDRYLLLETIELDIMSESGEAALKASVEQELARCQHAGAALDALPADITEAARLLKSATVQQEAEPLDVLFGLRLDNEFDSTRTGTTEYPLGLEWSDVLYFELFNRSEFEARQR
ncbi:hypothetical protein DDE05_21990 [Streptomyces cavourensis]|nr:hypothetical protein DDE05_21990 [Streptomyces cavourensis]